MTDVFEIALERRASLLAEIAEVDDFVSKAKSWWKMMGSAQKESAAVFVLPLSAQTAGPETMAA